MVALYPILATPFATPDSAHGRVINDSVGNYYDAKNLKRNLAAQAAWANPQDGIKSAAVTYGVYSVLFKFMDIYRAFLNRQEAKHPAYGNFVARHPIMGNAVGLLPGFIVTIPLAIQSAKLFKHGTDYLTRFRPVRSVLYNPYVQTAVAGLALMAALMTSFPAKLAQSFLGERRGLKDNLKEAQALNPGVPKDVLRPAVKERRDELFSEAQLDAFSNRAEMSSPAGGRNN